MPGIALVGSHGAVTVGVASGSITPAWGAGSSQTAGNLLICRVSETISPATLAATPSGWSVAGSVVSGVGTASVITFYKIATGGDAAPTIAGITSVVLQGQLDEYSGVSATPLDQTGTATGLTTPQAATAAGVDATSGSLILSNVAERYSAVQTNTSADSFNNGASASGQNDDATSTRSHYNFGDGVTTGNSAADSDSFSFITTSLTALAICIVSFKPAGAGGGVTGAFTSKGRPGPRGPDNSFKQGGR